MPSGLETRTKLLCPCARGGHTVEHQESCEEKSGLCALSKVGLKALEEEFDMMKIVATKGCCGTGDLD